MIEIPPHRPDAPKEKDLEIRERNLHIDRMRMELESEQQPNQFLLRFYDMVHGWTCESMLRQLSRFRRMDPSEGEITIMWTSYGGSVLDGFSVIDELESLMSSGWRINSIIRGFAFSMGLPLALTASRTFAGADSMLMVHKAYSGAYGSVEEQTATVELLGTVQEKVYQRIASKAKDPTSFLAKIKSQVAECDWYLTAEQAAEFGIVEIG